MKEENNPFDRKEHYDFSYGYQRAMDEVLKLLKSFNPATFGPK